MCTEGMAAGPSTTATRRKPGFATFVAHPEERRRDPPGHIHAHRILYWTSWMPGIVLHVLQIHWVVALHTTCHGGCSRVRKNGLR